MGAVSSATAYTLMAAPLACTAQQKEVKTIQDVIDFLISQVEGAPFGQTVDTVKSGDAGQNVSGIVTTFMPNCDVIKKTVDLGANLIITHEPTFYNHEDTTDWLEEDPVYQYKRKLLEENNIVVWRFHDYIHAFQPDPMISAVAEQLAWQSYVSAEKINIFNIPTQKVGNLAEYIKQHLGGRSIRIVGAEDMDCTKVGLLVGAYGGRNQISFLSKSDVEVLVVGEIHEWEISEYVRDAISAGQKKALIVAGHSQTEEPGMQWLAGWLNDQLSGIAVTHVHGEAPFGYL